MVLTRSGRQALIHLYPRSNRQAAATRLQSLPYTGRAPGTIRRRRHRPHARARIPPPPPPPPPPFQSAGLQQFRDATGLPNASAFYRAWGTQGADFQDTLLSHLNRRDINALGALDRNFRQNDHLTEHRLRPTLNAQAPRQPRPNGVQASCQETNVLPLPPTHQPSTYTPRCPNNYRSNVPIRWCDQNGPTHGALRQRYIGFNQALPPAQHPANYNVCGDHADITNQGPRAQLDLIQTRSPVCTRCERAELRRHDFDPYCGCTCYADWRDGWKCHQCRGDLVVLIEHKAALWRSRLRYMHNRWDPRLKRKQITRCEPQRTHPVCVVCEKTVHYSRFSSTPLVVACLFCEGVIVGPGMFL